MEDIYNNKHNNIFNRINKKFSFFEKYFIIKKKCFTDNTIYYFFCVLFRFIHLFSITDYFVITNNNNKELEDYFKLLTCHNIFKKYYFSFKIYIIIIIIILLLYIIRISIILYFINDIDNYLFNNNLLLLIIYQIIFEHIVFLFFTYLIEFLSFSYYIYFIPDKFIINMHDINKCSIIIIIIISTVLIILYNLENYINIICINKIYTFTIFEIYLQIKEIKNLKNSKTITYKCSNSTIFIFIFLQNFVLILNIENYLNNNIIIFKVVISVIFVLTIIILFLKRINEFNYINYFNLLINVLLLYYFYSIIINAIFLFFNYKITNITNELIIICLKMLISYITYKLFIFNNHKHFASKIIEIIFHEKNSKNTNKFFINSLYYFHQTMIKIKDENQTKSDFLLIKLINDHINICNKAICNCKLFENLLKNKNNKNKEKSEIIIIFNYIFESIFVEFNYYDQYDLIILLAEHFCYLKNNPIMSFSIINSFIQMKKNKISKFQNVILNELKQKYFYYLICNLEYSIQKGIKGGGNNIFFTDIKSKQIYYNNLIFSNKVKKLFLIYIDNQIKILNYKNIFEDTMEFKFDKSDNNIISVNIKFFEQNANSYNELEENNINKNNSKLYIIISLLKKEYLIYIKIIKSINQIGNINNIPVFLIFKYILFFDIIQGGKIPNEIINKFQSLLNLYNNYIKVDKYENLKKRYVGEINKKIYLIFELKKELRAKYFSENISIKLGFKQKEIINEQIDLLMPKEFYKSHNNAIKYFLIGQKIYYFSKEFYLFDKSTMFLYPVNGEGSLIYNLSKSLIIVFESIIKNDNYVNKYHFMVDNNMQLLSHSKNFEEDYYLNKSIIQVYNLNFMNILGIKPDKLKKIFKNEYKKIYEEKLKRQVKISEYFISQFYRQSDEKSFEKMNKNYFNNEKNNILLKISDLNNNEKDNNESINNDNDNENNNLIDKKFIENSIIDIFIKPSQIVIKNNYTFSLNKGTFIENLIKELVKVEDNNLNLEKDIINYNLIKQSNQLMDKLIKKSELNYQYFKILIKFCFIYDKIFYFITINTEKELYLKIVNSINNKKIISSSSTSFSSNKKINKKKSRNKSISFQNDILINNYNNIYDNNENYSILKKINNYKKKINYKKFFLFIKSILIIFIIFIIIIYFKIINFQTLLIDHTEEIFEASYYNDHTREYTLAVYSKLLEIFYDYSNLSMNILSNRAEYQSYILDVSASLKTTYYAVTDYFVYYGYLPIEHNYIFRKKKFIKLIGNWKEIVYESDYFTEFDYPITKFQLFNITNEDQEELNIDINNFIFFKQENKKLYTFLIRILYYFCINYEFTYKVVLNEVEESLFNSFRKYINSETFIYIFLEILGIFFWILILIISNIYLYFSNKIIIKSIIFLFLDFSQEDNHITKEKNNITKEKNYNLIISKLIELKNIINDFDLKIFDKYSENIDSINNQNYNSSRGINNIYKNNLNNKEKNEIKNETNYKDENRKEYKDINNSSQNYLVNHNSKNINVKINNNFMITNNDKLKKHKGDSSFKNKETKERETFQDIILNKSNKILIFIIKIYSIILLFLILIIILYILYKIIYSLQFKNKFTEFFVDLPILTNRYTMLYYYFDIFRTLILFPISEKREILENVMGQMEDYYEKENNKFLDLLSLKKDSYYETNILFNKLRDSNNNSTEKIKKEICLDNNACINYLNSEYNIFDSGVDFTFKRCMTQMSNFLTDYKKIKNKTDIKEINSTLIYLNFDIIDLSLNNMFFYVQERLYEALDNDKIKFIEDNYQKTINLNIISIIFTIISFLILVFIFISTYNYIKPIQNSIYRINLSMYNIKEYSLSKV